MQIYLRLLAASIRSRMQYKWDFIMTNLAYALITTVDFLTVATVLYRFRVVAGWDIYEVALLSGIASASFGLVRAFAPELHAFEYYLVTGEFDMLLIRPWPTLATLIARKFDLTRVGGAVQGYVLIAVGLREVVVRGAPAWMLWYVPLLPLAGALVALALNLLVATAGFWLIVIEDLSTFVINAPAAAANYPMDIYPAWLRRLLTGVLPVATMGYIPVSYGLGKGGEAWHLALPFGVAALSLLVAYRLWLWGERHYQSTGS